MTLHDTTAKRLSRRGRIIATAVLAFVTIAGVMQGSVLINQLSANAMDDSASAGLTPATAAPDAIENAFVTMINEHRAANGLAPLSVDPLLVTGARSWSTQMKAAGRISHDPNLSASYTGNWSAIGENVGSGPASRTLNNAFIASPGHNANLLRPDYVALGIGVVTDGPVIYVTERFLATGAPAPVANQPDVFAQTERQVVLPNVTLPPDPTPEELAFEIPIRVFSGGNVGAEESDIPATTTPPNSTAPVARKQTANTKSAATRAANRRIAAQKAAAKKAAVQKAAAKKAAAKKAAQKAAARKAAARRAAARKASAKRAQTRVVTPSNAVTAQ